MLKSANLNKKLKFTEQVEAVSRFESRFWFWCVALMLHSFYYPHCQRNFDGGSEGHRIATVILESLNCYVKQIIFIFISSLKCMA